MTVIASTFLMSNLQAIPNKGAQSFLHNIWVVMKYEFVVPSFSFVLAS